MRPRRARSAAAAVLTVLAVLLAACGGGGSAVPAGPSGPPQRGGEVRVLESAEFAGAWASGLDPATNVTGGANISMMQSIYGGLFLLRSDDDGANTRVEPNQAESYTVAPDGRTITITLRPGLRFSDGTPLDASAVAFNFNRSIASSCTCAPRWPLAANGIAATGPLTVTLSFTRPFAAVINSFVVSNVNWIASPTALQRMGEQAFAVTPVGAGPFTVQSNRLSSELVLVRNPTYFKPGLPYLDKLTFSSIGGDQPAYQALLSGQAQAYEGMVTTPLIAQAQDGGRLRVTSQPATSPYVIQLNTSSAPFTDPRAREAIYRATDVEAIRQGLFRNTVPASQSFTGPGGLFFAPTVPGYPTFDPNRARQLVAEVGGLTVDLSTLRNYVAEQVLTALRSQWEAVGIRTTLNSDDLSGLIQKFNSGQWQAFLQTAGSWDPDAGVGVPFRFRSDSPFTGVKDPAMDTMLNDASASLDPARRGQLYNQAGAYIAQQRYAPFLFAFAPANLTVPQVYGPGLSTRIPPVLVNTGVIWDEVWRQP